MDKRITKTKAAIRAALLELIEENSIEHIQVKELCDRAVINKTTFYRYYADIPQLLEVTRDEIADTIVEEFSCKEKLFEDPSSFFSSMYSVIACHEQEIQLLFPGNRISELIHRLDSRLSQIYLTEESPFGSVVSMSFFIGGASYACIKYLDRMEDATNVLIGLFDRMRL